MERRTLTPEEMEQYKREVAPYAMLRKEIDLTQAAELLNSYLNEWGTTKLAERWEVKNYNIYDLRKLIRKETGDDTLTEIPRGVKKKSATLSAKPKRAATKKKSLTEDIYEQRIKELEEQIERQQAQLLHKDAELEEARTIAAPTNDDIKTMLEIIQEQSEQVAAAVQDAQIEREQLDGIAFKFEGEYNADHLKKRLEKVIHMVEGEPSTYDIKFHIWEKPRKDITPEADPEKEQLREELNATKQANEAFQKQLDDLSLSIMEQEEEMKKLKETADLINSIESGYTALKTDKQGLHHPQSEYKKKEDESTGDENQIPKQSTITRHGIKCFQSFYHCPKCKDRAKTYTPKGSEYVNCKKCGEGMEKRDATEKGFPNVDIYGNVYIAGDYEMNI